VHSPGAFDHSMRGAGPSGSEASATILTSFPRATEPDGGRTLSFGGSFTGLVNSRHPCKARQATRSASMTAGVDIAGRVGRRPAWRVPGDETSKARTMRYRDILKEFSGRRSMAAGGGRHLCRGRGASLGSGQRGAAVGAGHDHEVRMRTGAQVVGP